MKKISELINLKGTRALITGAAGSIGQEIALTIAELGGDLILVDLPSSNYDLVKKSVLDNWNVDIKCIDCDSKCMICIAMNTNISNRFEIAISLVNKWIFKNNFLNIKAGFCFF